MVRAERRFDEGFGLGLIEENSDIASMNIIMAEGNHYGKSTCEGATEAVPPFMGTFDAAAVALDVITRSCEATFHDMAHLLFVRLYIRC